MAQPYSLQRTVHILLFLFLIVAGLYYAKPFLVPFCFGVLLAMLFLPLSIWFERKGIPKFLAILLCILLFLGVVVGIIWLISWQIADLVSQADNLQGRIKQMITQIEESIRDLLGISPREQEKFIQKQVESSGNMISRIGFSLRSFVVGFLLTLVYIFLFLYYRDRIKNFILKLVPAQQKKNTEVILQDTEKVSQKYLMGLGLMILCLWIMYGIAFSIVGVKYAILLAVLCGILEIVPYIGNFTGNMLAILMVIIQGGGLGMVIGVLITYAVIQFLQSNFLETLVVGKEVNVNPLFVILGLVVGQLIWGIPGMVLAIPLLGIVKIFCDHIEPLKPYGYIIGSEKKKRRGFLGKQKSRV